MRVRRCHASGLVAGDTNVAQHPSTTAIPSLLLVWHNRESTRAKCDDRWMVTHLRTL